jgi:hypothetical protein
MQVGYFNIGCTHVITQGKKERIVPVKVFFMHLQYRNQNNWLCVIVAHWPMKDQWDDIDQLIYIKDLVSDSLR